MVWKPLYLTILLCVSHNKQASGCTVFIVGKDASADGSVLVSHSNDGEFNTDPRLVKVPRQSFAANAKRPVFFSPEDYPRYVGHDRQVPEYYPTEDNNQSSFEPIGYIPQGEGVVSETAATTTATTTFGYLEETYGALNDQQLGIGESTCSGVFGAIPLGAPNGTALLSVDELTHIAMERASTAREAVLLMGSLGEEYGFYGAGEFEGTSESLAVSDTEEAWIFHILPDPTGKSCIWAAQKVPDNGFAVLANMFVIRQVDPNDTENFLMSKSVHQVAKEYNWWSGVEQDGLLDFTKVYSDGEYSHKYYSGRRMWGAYHLACPSCKFPAEYVDLQSDPVYPVWTVPDQPISVEDLFRYHRYTYQNTPFDLGAEGNLAAGPFGTPDRWKAGPGEKQVGGNWERAIGLYRTSDTYVVQSKKGSSLGGILWFGPASALGTVFTPFLVKLKSIPKSFSTGYQGIFSRDSAFWAACYAHNIANLKWSYAIQDLQARQDTLEKKSVDLMQQLEADYQMNTMNKTNDQDSWDAVESAILNNAAGIVSSLWQLSDEIMFKYASGFVNEDDSHGGLSQMVGYPEWWLEAVGFKEGPPPPPTKPKCCNPPKASTGGDNKKTTGLRNGGSSMELSALATISIIEYFFNRPFLHSSIYVKYEDDMNKTRQLREKRSTNNKSAMTGHQTVKPKKRKIELSIKERVALVKRFNEKYGELDTLAKSIDDFLIELHRELGLDATPTPKTFRGWIKKVSSGQWTAGMDQRRQKGKRKLSEDVSNTTDTTDTTAMCMSEGEFATGLQVFGLFPVVKTSNSLPAVQFAPCQESDTDEVYDHLFSQPEVMKLYGSGCVMSRENVEERVRKYCKRWNEGCPFSAFTARLPDEEKTFLGLVVLGFSEEENTAELAGLLRRDFWNKGFATVGMEYIISHAKKVFQEHIDLEGGEAFERIVATAHPENIASRCILEGHGFRQYTPPQRWLSGRLYYEYRIPPILRLLEGIP
ncbi:MAG: hypothetical protein SGBAC_001775 [Bacillariaceae sp.]